MITVNKSQVILFEGKLIAEASTLELAPGEWPDFIAVVDDKNEGYLFQRALPIYRDDEFSGYSYADWASGVGMTVFND